MHLVVADLHDRRSLRRVKLEDEITIGSAHGCSVVIDDPRLGPVQTKISISGTSIWIENLDPAADTRVNGESIHGRGAVWIDRATVISIGDTILRFSSAHDDLLEQPPMRLAPDPGGVEGTFLDALRARPDDLDARLVYADWLEQQDRLAMATVVRHAASAAPLDPATRFLANRMDRAWRALVWCGPIDHCPKAADGPRPACPRRWELLPSGGHPLARPCVSCGHEVELVDHVEAIDERVFATRRTVRTPLVVGPSLDRAHTLADLEAPRRSGIPPGVVLGRPARVDGVPRLAEVRGGAEWCAHPQAAGEPAADLATRQRAAAAWARAAREEHASIAAFSALSLQLLALGAPPDLIAACHAAALDEIRHAQRAFELASSFAGQPLAPSRLDEATRVGGPTTPRALARETFLDGCLNETAAALEARLASRAAGGSLAPLLAGIADDEERHAELAWQIVAWCVRTTGPDLALELARVLASLEAPPLPDAADDPALLACGIAGERGRAEVRAEALTRAAARLATLAPAPALAPAPTP